MSYSMYDQFPEGSDIIVAADMITFRLVCPRCGETSYYPIAARDLLYGFTIECGVIKCTEPGRPGFVINFEPSWSGYILGLEDRPLKHD